jgi:hypothetical protein
MSDYGVTAFVNGYIDGALWSSNDNTDESGGEPLDSGKFELSDEARDSMTREAETFYNANQHLWEDNDDYKAGVDFWLTRNHHGAGFWDGDYAKGKELTKLAHAAGECNLVIGDDELIYLY